ncbi:interaptin-like [Bicyclus anynana]|uniref:Interaptin-like n=1 Tax=Bicyclus anynana TaxID=110368 RepID=A0ABM3M7T0_BICAN|nr:interaptin-like [Bicyclus anynana]
MLIAGDLFPYIYDGRRILPETSGMPVALNSIFGYVIAGPTELSQDSNQLVPTCVQPDSQQSTINFCGISTHIDHIMSSFWNLENIPSEVPRNPDDILAEQLFAQEHSRDSSGRLKKVSLSADICKMYRQIDIERSQRPYQHIVWRYSQDQPVQVYELNTVTYGVASSPYLAIKVLHTLADDEAETYPQAANVLKTAFFMDDFLWSVDSDEEAINLLDELIALLRRGGFLLRKWSSNSLSVLKHLPDNHRETPLEFDDETSFSIKVLGLQWSPASDSFSFSTAPSNPVVTKRTILSQIGRQFDPLGSVQAQHFAADIAAVSKAEKCSVFLQKLNPFIDSDKLLRVGAAHDVHVDEMQETIINKDAKLSAMQNTIAVMEHDVCEPYCVYAHIYTALEKIFGTLCQNGKYKQYLDLLTAGKDTRNIDIKGKILFKMKVLEKFSLALIAPCSQDFSRASKDCPCYRAEVVTTFALTSAESQLPSLDSKRAQLVADIMENQEMKEILSKTSSSDKTEEDQFNECTGIDNCCIGVENLNRLKNLQTNYSELLTCYDNLKYERDCLYLRCQKIADLEHECQCLKNNLNEYNELWKEKEYYKKRSEDLDTLKENFYILTEETRNVETKLKAEQEINKMKTETVDQLRGENIKLENKIGDISVLFEKQKNVLICKLKECECKMMCQDQQIKSLSNQIDTLLEQDKHNIPSNEVTSRSVQLIDEIESQKEQIKNLKDDLYCSEEEKQYLQEEFEKKLELINDLKLDVEDWKSRYEEAMKSYNYLEMQLDELQCKHSLINQELENKTSAITNLNNMICNKSQEINSLMEEVDSKKDQNKTLVEELKNSRDIFEHNIGLLINEKREAMNSIIMAKQESVKLLKHLNNDDLMNIFNHSKNNEFEMDENIDNDILVKEIELLHETNLETINILQNENVQLKKSFDLAKKESLILDQKLLNHENLLQKYENIKKSHENLLNEKESLQLELKHSKNKLENLFHEYQLTKTKSDSLLDESEDIKEEYTRLNKKYQKVLNERNLLQKSMFDKDAELKILINTMHSLKLENELFLSKIQEISELQNTLIDLKHKFDELLYQKNTLQSNFDIKSEEINKLYANLTTQTEENQRLQSQIKMQETQKISINDSVSNLRNENYNMQLNLDTLKNESSKLQGMVQHYKNIENKYQELQLSHKQIESDNEHLQKDLDELKKIQQQNAEYSKSLEKALVQFRDENTSKRCSLNELYADLKNEVDKLREEKLKSLTEVKSLMDKIDESECVINNLNDDIFARDKKISTLENHINELQVEITALQNDLKEVVESGEQLKDLSYEKLNQTVKKIEAHQSKATHNMRVELAKLQNEKDNLENELSSTKLTTEESENETKNNRVLINQLKNERESIISHIKQLEIKSIGRSTISPSKCSTDKVIKSLDRIGKYINDKNNSLQQTLINVQTSYQLLKSKAEEAKTIAEKEQQKIMLESGQTQKQREILEKQLADLTAKINTDKLKYENVIKDLEGEMLNQKLIFDKIKQSKEDHILKLTREFQILKDQCNNYETEINDLQLKIEYTSEQNSKNIVLIEKGNQALETKDKLVLVLQKQVDDLKNKPSQQAGNQTYLFLATIDSMCQTDKDDEKISHIEAVFQSFQPIATNDGEIQISDISTEKKLQKSLKISDPPNNEVQILTANIEPKIDFVRHIYLKYKLKRLGPGKLEQHSITSLEDTTFLYNNGQNSIQTRESKTSKSSSAKDLELPLNVNNNSILDIYNSEISIDSTKVTEYFNDKEGKSSLTLGNNKDFRDPNKKDSKKNINDNLSQSTENDFSVIYKDSDSIVDGQKVPRKLNGRQRTSQKGLKYLIQEKVSIAENNEERDDDSIKPQLKIHLPIVKGNSLSSMTTSDYDDKKSVDSLVLPDWEAQSETNKVAKHFDSNFIPIPVSKYQKKKKNTEETHTQQYVPHNKIQSSNTVKLENTANNKINFPHDSKHKLSRVGGTIFDLQNNTTIGLNKPTDNFSVKSNYGLQYILNTMQNELNPNNTRNLGIIDKSVHKSHSIERFANISESRPSKQFSSLKISSIENGTTSTCSPVLTSSVECGTLVKMDDQEDYAIKIEQLVETLEKQYNKKLEAIKAQYDNNVQFIINEHNQGIKSIQNLHEESLHDLKKDLENEVEILRTLSSEAINKAEKLKIENDGLKSKFKKYTAINLNVEPIQIQSLDFTKKKCKCVNRVLTKTDVQAYNVKPRKRSHGPCTCSLDVNISDTIRNIFKHVEVDQRNVAEQSYLKYLAKKILEDKVEMLNAEELSFLHFKVCRTWKSKLCVEEANQLKFDSLGTELIIKQRQTQKQLAELDRKVEEELHRLQEVREAVCYSQKEYRESNSPALVNAAEKDIKCACNITVGGRQFTGDHTSTPYGTLTTCWKRKRGKLESNRATLTKFDGSDGRRDKGLVSDEPPTRLRRSQERHHNRIYKK